MSKACRSSKKRIFGIYNCAGFCKKIFIACLIPNLIEITPELGRCTALISFKAATSKLWRIKHERGFLLCISPYMLSAKLLSCVPTDPHSYKEACSQISQAFLLKGRMLKSLSKAFLDHILLHSWPCHSKRMESHSILHSVRAYLFSSKLLEARGDAKHQT